MELTQQQALKEPFELQNFGASSVTNVLYPVDDTASDDAGYDADPEGRHSRQREYFHN